MNYKTTPPSWQPDAVPSDRGWRHPVTGELLVSVRGGVQLPVDEKEEVAEEAPAEKPVKKASRKKKGAE